MYITITGDVHRRNWSGTRFERLLHHLSHGVSWQFRDEVELARPLVRREKLAHVRAQLLRGDARPACADDPGRDPLAEVIVRTAGDGDFRYGRVLEEGALDLARADFVA